MELLKRAFEGFKNLFGFKKNPKYVKNYLNEANIRSGIYMGGVIILLELWLIIRQTNKYVKPGISDYSGFTDKFKFAYSFLNLYILFLFCGLSLMIYAITYLKNRKKDTKAEFILNLVFGSLCVFWFFMIFPADDLKNLFPLEFSKSSYPDETTRARNIVRYLNVPIYGLMPLFGSLILAHTIYKHFKHKNNTVISICIIITFAAICLIFGVRVSYYDFCYPVESIERRKMLTCFFTMTVFVACLLIFKPYISIIMLITIFMVFRKMLFNYGAREFVEGDDINYITFLVALIMITISMYQQRINEANKDMHLEHDAKYDYLVDIYNVKYISSKIDLKTHQDLSFIENKIYLFINIVNFRTINDQKGFEAGDLFLKKVGLGIKKLFSGELVSRQSDDHFVVFANDSNLDYKIKELSKTVKEYAMGLYVELKVGGYRPKRGELPNRCIDKARYACGMIKRKNKLYIEYDDNMDEVFIKHQYIVNNLDLAIKNNWIQAYYQPVVWSHTKELCGAEALARWIDPKYGFLSPADFISVLENTRLIHKLDTAIIEFACREMRRALNENKPIVPVSINFSRLDFELMDVEKTLESIVEKYNIDRRFIHVEITESALADNVESLNTTIKNLKEKGYTIWLDDFGSGYSSLNVLKDFMFDVVKIDMKFLSNFNENERTKDILEYIIKLVNRLNMKSLTEGVETKEQAEFLDNMGCGRLQGYLFGKPFKIDDFESRIEEGIFKVSKDLL